MFSKDQMGTYNRIMSDREVQKAYQKATCERKQTPRNIRRACRLQETACQTMGFRIDTTITPLSEQQMTGKERAFIKLFKARI